MDAFTLATSTWHPQLVESIIFSGEDKKTHLYVLRQEAIQTKENRGKDSGSSTYSMSRKKKAICIARHHGKGGMFSFSSSFGYVISLLAAERMHLRSGLITRVMAHASQTHLTNARMAADEEQERFSTHHACCLIIWVLVPVTPPFTFITDHADQ